ncbi:TPA: zinc ribbon domain-containing protein [Escherichia coli]|nr:zinc ribbon domain-containing protein [Escherichia coli]
MKFSVFDNLNGTTNVSLNKKIVKTNEMTNNRNKLKAFVGSFTDIHRNVRAKMLTKIENALTVKDMRNFEIGMSELNDKPAIVAYTTDKAVIICSEANRWKALGSDLTLVHAKESQNFVQQYIGDFIEIKEEIEFPTEQKVDVISNELEELRKEIEKMKKEKAEDKKLISAYAKNYKGDELSFDEDLTIIKHQNSIKSEVGASEISNESTVFSVTETAENLNDDLIVSIDQSNKENKMPLYDYSCECGNYFEKTRKISERSSAECPECHKEAKQQLTAPAGIQNGYYEQGRMFINRNKQTFKTATR